jgi:hypothetical protein
LVVRPYLDDADRRLLVFRWKDCAGDVLGPPGEEGQHLTPLENAGFRDVLWAGEVFNSPWNWWLRGRYRHFVMRFKDDICHAFAETVTVGRLDTATTERVEILGDRRMVEYLDFFYDRPPRRRVGLNDTG